MLSNTATPKYYGTTASSEMLLDEEKYQSIERLKWK